MIREFHINILTPLRLSSREEASIVIDLLCNRYPDLSPERYGNYEPLKLKLDTEHPEELLKVWDDGVYWKHKSPKSCGSVCPETINPKLHTWMTLSIDANKANVEMLFDFVKESSTRLKADFASLHLLVEQEIPLMRATHTGGCLDPARGRYSQSITTHRLKNNLPDLYWVTILGPAYVKHFGKERILSSPAPIVQELGENCIFLQMSDSPFDFETKYESVNHIRNVVKQYLNLNSFFDFNALADHIYNVPEFDFGCKEQ